MELKKSPEANLENKKNLFFQIGLVISLGLVLLAFEWTTRPAKMKDYLDASNSGPEMEIIPITQQKIEQPPPPEPPKVVEVLEIVDNTVEVEDLDISIESDDKTAIMALNLDLDDEESSADDEIFVIVEDMPRFMGQDKEAFRKWIAENLKYPDIAAENNIQGRVFVQFAINSKGELVDSKVVRGVDPALDAEALRVVRSSPKWEPGKQRGKPVKVQFTFPINFVLN
jgi:periplasmic protein TonB